MDCFYVAVERRRDPALLGLPCAVVQYNARQAGGAADLAADADRRVQGHCAGGIIAVSYEARARGVTRQMRPAEAKKQCPEIVLVQVPTAYGKADLRIYKDAGDEVAQLLARRAGACEKRSVDEVAVDITVESERLLQERDWDQDILPAAQKASHLADSALSLSATAVSKSEARNGHAGQRVREAGGSEQQARRSPWDWSFFWGQAERRLIAGAVVVEEMRAGVAAELGFECSGGVAQNKMLAKLGCGLHKPNQQTVVLPEAVGPLLQSLPLERLPGLGGDLGAQIKERLGVATASELASVPRAALEAAFPRQAEFLQRLAEGRHSEPVQERVLCKSLSSGKTFIGRLRLNTVADCEKWLGELAKELHQRYLDGLSRHRRAPTKISVSVGVGSTSSSRQGSIDLGSRGTVEQICAAGCACLRRWAPAEAGGECGLGVTSLGMSLSAMQPIEAGVTPVTHMLCAAGVPPAGRKDAARAAPGAPPSDTGAPAPVVRLLQAAAARAEAAPSAVSGGPIDVDAEPDADPAVRPGGVDATVLAALPAAVQAEVLAQMAPQEQAKLRAQMRAATPGREPLPTPARAPPATQTAKRRRGGGGAAAAGGIAAYFRPHSA